MTFFGSLLVLFVASAAGQVLDRIQTTTLSFVDEICGNLTAIAATNVEQCVGLDLGVLKTPSCIPVAQANCLIKGLQSAFTNFTSDDVELPFRWLCSADLQCGIATRDTNSTGGSLGAINGTTSFGSSRVVGFIDAGASLTRQVRLPSGGVAAIDKRVEYVFSFDFCFANATTQDQHVEFDINIANATAEISSNIVPQVTVTAPANAVQSTCGRVVVRVPHYALFQHIGINGFDVKIGNDVAAVGGAPVRLFIDNVLVCL